ncbi:hypothetical protein BPOR_0112g00180 [Botrytis porri]|uniref:Uncharacterized protein n=1 Tax=Botrytis porri TaxID=87229 RepID=A0A4Z1KXT2_9HELO|nr:hypothetical protein BPOR_0112g00180 [Botrytis porri]
MNNSIHDASRSKGSKDEKSSGSTTSRDTRIQNLLQKSWNNRLKTMRQVQKKDNAEDGKANGVQGVLADAAQMAVDTKKQSRKIVILG